MEPLPDRARTGAATRLRTLVRHRRLVGAALTLAILAFLVATVHPTTLRPRSYTVGKATALVLVDYPTSAVVDAPAADGIPLMAFRSRLLADLVMKPVLLDALAARLGVPRRLVVADPPGLAPAPPSRSVSVADRRAYVISAETPSLDGGANPIMLITTRAPTTAAAARTATAVVMTLTDHLARLADAQGTPAMRRLRLRPLSPPDSRPLRHGRGPATAAAAATAAFLLVCWLITTLAGPPSRRAGGPDPVGA
jgi:hypothetical protein